MNRKQSIALCAILCLFLGCGMILNFVTPSKAFSDTENRPLAQMPDFTVKSLISGKFTSEYETYLVDQFFARDMWTGLKYFAERTLLKTENNGIYFADDGRLLEHFEAPADSRIETNLKAVSDIAKNTGKPTHFTLIPTSAYIYSELLPKNAPTYDQQRLLDAARDKLSDKYFDVSQSLLEKKSDYIYYRTDHHWTTLGAYTGYTRIAQQLGFEPVALPENKRSVDYFYGTLYTRSGARYYPADVIDYYPMDNLTVTDEKGESVPLYDEEYFEKKDKYALFLSSNHPLAVVKNSANPNGEKLVLIKDSFSNSMVPFLAQHFSEVHMIDPRYYKLPMSQYVRENDIDRVLVAYQTANFVQDASIVFVSK